MRPVQRDELIDHVTWSERRRELLPELLEVKRRRRIHLGPELTFHFENRATVRYQVQEMMRVERLVREADIQHELDTYNALLPRPGELACTLMIEIVDRDERAQKLQQWLQLPEHLYVSLEDGRKIPARFDGAQRDATRLSSVQFLRFPVGHGIPVAIGSALPGLELETRFSDEQRQALREDLAEGLAES